MIEHSAAFNAEDDLGHSWKLAFEEVGLRAMSGEIPTIDTIQKRTKEAAFEVINMMESTVGGKGGFTLLQQPFETLALLVLMNRIKNPINL